jgi:excisionase family DNA binding protein
MEARMASISDIEPRAVWRPQALTLAQFCRQYGIGRTLAYDEIRAGRLRARRCGRRVLISEADAQSWLALLPVANDLVADDGDGGAA